MKVMATCSGCEKTLAVSDEHAGKRIRCPVCGEAVQLPAATARPGGSLDQYRSLESPSLSPMKARPIPNYRESNPRRESAPVRSRGLKEEGQRPAKSQGQGAASAHDEVNLWDGSFNSYAYPEIPDEQLEQYGGRSKKKEREPETRSPYYYPSDTGSVRNDEEAGYAFPLIMAGVGLVIAAMSAMGERMSPGTGIYGGCISLAIAGALVFWGGVSIAANAFREDFVCGFLYLLFSPYALYFLFSRWDVNRRPFMIHAIGLVSMAASMAMLGAGLGQ